MSLDRDCEPYYNGVGAYSTEVVEVTSTYTVCVVHLPRRWRKGSRYNWLPLRSMLIVQLKWVRKSISGQCVCWVCNSWATICSWQNSQYKDIFVPPAPFCRWTLLHFTFSHHRLTLWVVSRKGSRAKMLRVKSWLLHVWILWLWDGQVTKLLCISVSSCLKLGRMMVSTSQGFGEEEVS